MKKLTLLTILSCVVILGTSCGKEKLQEQATEPKANVRVASQTIEEKEPKQVQNEAYLSFAVMKEGSGNVKTMMSTFTYDLKSKKLEKHPELELYSEYPLSVYSKYDNKIYYTYRDKEGGDQLWSFDVQTKKKECLTKTLFAINSIIPVKNHLYFVAVQGTEDTSAMGFFEYKDGKIIRLLEDTDAFVWRVNVNSDVEKILLDTYSNSEIYNNFEKDSSSDIIGENTLYTYDIKENKIEKVYHTKEVGQGWNMAIASDNTIYYQLGDLYHVKDGKSKIDTEFDHLDMKSILYINDTELYYCDDGSKVVKYNRKTKEEEIIFEVKEEMESIKSPILLY